MRSCFGRKPYIIRRNKSPAPNNKKIIPDKQSDFHKKLLIKLEPDIEIYQKTREQLHR